MLNPDDMSLFITVADLKSFTAAAKRTDLPKSSISRRLRKLEDHLGVRLLERTTRTISLTEAGQSFYHSAVKILSEIEVTEQQISQNQLNPTGHLRLCAPDQFIRQTLQDPLVSFAREQPQLRIEVLSGTVGQHLLGDRLDIMIHIDMPEDSSFIARRITKATSNYYASPAYLQEFGQPSVPEDLLQHRCVLETRNPTKHVNHWLFRSSEGVQEITVSPHYSADTTYLSLKFVEEGLGVAMLPDHCCRDSLHEGRLVKLFDGRFESQHDLFAIYPSRRHVPAKVQAFLEYMNRSMPEYL